MRAREARKAAIFQQFILNRRLGRVKKIGWLARRRKYFGRKRFGRVAVTTGIIGLRGRPVVSHRRLPRSQRQEQESLA